MEPNDGFNKGNYLRVPPLLVNASGLEAYLSRLSIQLNNDIISLRKRMEECNLRVTDSSDTVRRVKRFLLVNAKRGMEECLFGTLDDGNDAEIDHYLNEIIPSDTKGVDEGASESEVIAAMLGVATKLVRDNGKLKAALTENTNATHSFIKIQEDMLRQMQEIREQMEQHKRNFDGLSIWLGTYDPGEQITRLPPSELSARPANPEVGCSDYFHPAFSPALEKEVDTIFSRSPLLLALRRIVTRELSKRMAHFSDMNAKDVEGAMEKVKSELATYPLPPSLAGSFKSQEAQQLALMFNNCDQRLKDIENLTRHDRVAGGTLKPTRYSGAFSSLTSNPSSLVQMEAREYINNRYAELEERLVYLESEREEFRNMLRTLLEWNQRQQAIPAHLMEQLQLYAATAPQRKALRSRAQLIDLQEDPNVVGVLGNRGMGKVEGRRIFPTEEMMSARAGSTGTGPSRLAIEANLDTHKSSAAPHIGDLRTEECAASLTGSQTTYARYISDVFNRRDVNKLPPLPYESLLKK
ncbi:unnamed protein product [Phytomonas sp. EM1]|nr:unnamed protein product [Phytomonas sp. EM1]|eukprot:CCW63702.1 unnamed protein product [Phytomonas sp. isolate EM1]